MPRFGLTGASVLSFPFGAITLTIAAPNTGSSLNFPPVDRDAYSDEAWRLAHDIVGTLAPAELPMDDRAASVAYVYGLLFCVLTLEATLGVQGIRLHFPPLAELGAEHDRLISYETLLPFIDRDVSPQEARWLTDRLRGVAALVTRQS